MFILSQRGLRWIFKFVCCKALKRDVGTLPCRILPNVLGMRSWVMNLFRAFSGPLDRGSAITRPILRRHQREHLLPEKTREGCVNSFLPLGAHDSMSHGLALEVHCIVMRALSCGVHENYSSQASLCSIGLGRGAPQAVKHITPGPWPTATIQATASRLSRSAPREEYSRSHDPDRANYARVVRHKTRHATLFYRHGGWVTGSQPT